MAAPTMEGAGAETVQRASQALLDAQCRHLLISVERVKAGATHEGLDRLSDQANRCIRRELVEPHGEDGRAAALDAADRMLVVARLLADEWGVDLDADGARAAPSSSPLLSRLSGGHRRTADHRANAMVGSTAESGGPP